MDSLQTGELKLVGDYSIRNVGELARTLAGLLGAGTPLLLVNTEQVTELDTAALQVLLAACKTAKASKQRLVIEVAQHGAMLNFLAAVGLATSDGHFPVPEAELWIVSDESQEGLAA
jgi:ABC-type transporter Mla MlaB component